MEDIARLNYLQSRPRHPRDEATRFIETQIAPASEANPVYNERLNGFVLVGEAESEDQISADMWKEADEDINKLIQMTEKLREKLTKGKTEGNAMTLVKADLRNCTWEEVMGEVEMTKLAGATARRYTKIEEAVFKALSDIPEAMESARKYVQIYDENRDRSLEKKTFDLFRAILRALLQIMKFFADSKTRKILQPLLQQNTYKSGLVDSIEDIRKHTVRVLEEAHRCHQERSNNHERISLQTNQNSEKQLQYQEASVRILSDLRRFFKESLILKHKNELLGPNAAFLMNNALAATASRMPCQSPPTPPSEITASRLLEAIRYDHEVIVNDIRATIQRGLALDEQPKAVAASLVTHPRFDAYFGPTAGSDVGQPASSALLVNGRMNLTTSEGVLPLGLVVAEVARVSTGRRGAYVVSYFCDRHRPGFCGSSAEATDPVSAVVAGFIGQLLTQMRAQQEVPDFTFLKEEDWPRLRRGRLNTLCVVFLALVTQLPPGSVLLCMIDGASQYETAALSTNMEALTRRLVRLVDNSQREDEEQEQRLVYKLLVTCRARARGISQYFDQDPARDGGGILNLDGDIEATDSSTRRIASLRNAGRRETQG